MMYIIYNQLFGGYTMKKTIIVLLMIFSCVFLFAEKNHQVFAGFQFRNEDFDSEMFKNYFVELDSDGAKADIKSVYDKVGAISLGYATFNKDSLLVGFYNSFSLTFPYYTTMRNTVEDFSGEIQRLKDFKFYGLGIDWFFGPGLYLVNIPLLKVPVALGGHVYGDMDWDSGEQLALKATAGIGGVIGAEIHLFALNVFVQCQIAYDFYGCARTPDAEFFHGKTKALSVMPQIGVGLKF